MAKVVVGMTISLDGFVNDRHGSVERLYADFAALATCSVTGFASSRTLAKHSLGWKRSRCWSLREGPTSGRASSNDRNPSRPKVFLRRT
jgi:hypothetical protein